MSSVPRREIVVRAALVVMGAITATPALALVSTYILEWTYGVDDVAPMTQALLQHRGMLQLLLGSAMIWAAFFPPARLAAALAGILGKSTFLALILPDPALRADLAPFSIGFDLACVVLLGGLAVQQLLALRSRQDPRRRPQAV